jgi:hypothetical protein
MLQAENIALILRNFAVQESYVTHNAESQGVMAYAPTMGHFLFEIA